jgi:para-nitrobenzyl esterase
MSALLLVIALAACGGGSSGDGPVVQTDAGPVRGVTEEQLLAWRGVPYAAPPTGALRWMPPQRPQSWSTPLDASNYGNFCSQNADLGVFGMAGGSEDCLNLNVFVSSQAAKSTKPLPVFVWIHGGGLKVGAGRDYDARKLAIDGGAVVVTLNYRLGMFGYFAHPALKREGQPAANYGLMDQQLALDWVQRNIKAFGGDPTNVTIAGESSGGNSVISHVVAPGSAGKFQHAIVMSGGSVALKYPTFGAPLPIQVAEGMGTGFAKAVGCETGDVAACLRALPASTVLAQQTPYLTSQVFIDGKVLPMHPGEALRSGQFNRVATLINGNTRDEATFFAAVPENDTGKPMDEAGYVASMEFFYGAHAAQAMKQYPTSAYPSLSEAFAAAVTDSMFACTARAINRWMAGQTPTYAYEFADRTAPSYLKPTSFGLAAAHTFELPYLFPRYHGGSGIPVELNALQTKLSDTMVRYWTSAGSAQERQAEWPRYDAAQDNYLSLVAPQPLMTVGSFGRNHQCDFWDALGVY